MKIIVSGEKKEVAENLTVAALIEQEKVETPQYVTVSVNEEFFFMKVMRWSSFTLWEEGSNGIYQ